MTVTLLRQVLIEMGATFNSSDLKKKLVERVLTESLKNTNTSTALNTDTTTNQDRPGTSSASFSRAPYKHFNGHYLLLRVQSGNFQTRRAKHLCHTARKQYVLRLLL